MHRNMNESIFGRDSLRASVQATQKNSAHSRGRDHEKLATLHLFRRMITGSLRYEILGFVVRGQRRRGCENLVHRLILTSDIHEVCIAHVHCAVHPPSTARLAPVMSDDAGDARKTTAAATSAGVPRRPNGILD